MKNKIGLVLSGGGGKGAYQIGVWKALRESGLEKYISAVSGTSVGALNAALFVQGNLEIAEHIWAEEISMEKLLGKVSLDELSKCGMFSRHGLEKMIGDFVSLKIFSGEKSFRKKLIEELNKDIVPLEIAGKLIAENIDLSRFDMPCYVACKSGSFAGMHSFHGEEITYHGSDVKQWQKNDCNYFNLKYFTEEQRKTLLLASTAMPFIYGHQKLSESDSVWYRDGGTEDNVPSFPLIMAERCDIILAVHLNLAPKDKYRKWARPDEGNAHVMEIRPKACNGYFFTGTLDFHKSSARKRISLGYEDNIELFSKMMNNISRGLYLNELEYRIEEKQNEIKNYDKILRDL